MSGTKVDIPLQEILRRATAAIKEIDQLFVDTAYWNRRHPNEEPIDADPDGRLKKERARLSSFIEDRLVDSAEVQG